MISNNQTCETCMFMRKLGDRMTCHRYPPSWATEGKSGDSYSNSCFPELYENYWCGEYKPISLKEDDESPQQPFPAFIAQRNIKIGEFVTFNDISQCP